MKNFELLVVYASDSIPIHFTSGSEAVQWLGGYGEEDPIKRVLITAIADDGRRVCISISNDSDTKASVRIEEPEYVSK